MLPVFHLDTTFDIFRQAHVVYTELKKKQFAYKSKKEKRQIKSEAFFECC